MSFARASAVCASAMGLLLAGCASHSGGSSLVPSPAADTPTQSSAASPTNSLGTLSVAVASSSSVRIQGSITSVSTGRFVVYTGANGNVPVYTSSSTKIVTSGKGIVTGAYAIVSGTGSTATSVNALLVGTYSANPGTSSFTGTLESSTAYGYAIKSDANGAYIPVGTTKATTSNAALSVGAHVSSSGVGSTAGAHFANTINTTTAVTSSTATPAPATSTVMKHLLTADYLLGRYGTRSVAPSTAAAHLTLAQTGWSDANAIAAAGIKTQIYLDPNRWETNAPMFGGGTEAMYAHTCTGARITSTYKTVVRYVTNPNSAALQSYYASYIKAHAAGIHVDSIFEDDAGPLSQYSVYTPFSAMPCSYSDSSWINGGMALDNASPIPVMVNGLSGLNGHEPSRELGLLKASNVVGGIYEHCYTDNSTLKMVVWEWQAIENTELQATNGGDQFICMARNTNTASTQAPARIWAIASFLLTYNPSRSYLWEEFGTPSGLHVMPESKLVALNPLVAQPASVSSLLTSTGNYGREYGSCYIGGSSVGPCAVVLNITRSSTYANPYAGRYGHTLALSGNGVLDGGTISTAGAAAPSSIGPSMAYVLFK